jgi:hypothetical protein
MKRVPVTSVGFKWVVPELHSDKALRLREDYRNGILELIAPDVFPIKIAHALTRADMMNTQPQLFSLSCALQKIHRRFSLLFGRGGADFPVFWRSGKPRWRCSEDLPS